MRAFHTDDVNATPGPREFQSATDAGTIQSFKKQRCGFDMRSKPRQRPMYHSREHLRLTLGDSETVAVYVDSHAPSLGASLTVTEDQTTSFFPETTTVFPRVSPRTAGAHRQSHV